MLIDMMIASTAVVRMTTRLLGVELREWLAE
jgi:hypothetical protein